eukprot:TRINITY_DN3346_c0_g2_i2.p1 TRINITY_DN3346_c0_g2~~TRINITY_DN3346_c0_g2_i2.p1  ORF type:complete len:428 (+),score=54.18 TRINITY_DN3346_c0_g2_i2:66-1349(+)
MCIRDRNCHVFYVCSKTAILYEMPTYLSGLFILFALLAPARTRIESVVVLVRGGARTPVGSNLLSEGFLHHDAFLSPLGQREMFLLGTELRHRYIESTKLLPESYSAPNIRVLTSDAVRSFDSANSLLQGLYPPPYGQLLEKGLKEHLLVPPMKKATFDHKKTHPFATSSRGIGAFDIHIIPKSEDYYFRASKVSYCPRLKSVFNSVTQTPEYAQLKEYFLDKVYRNFVEASRKYLPEESHLTCDGSPNLPAVHTMWENYQTNAFHGMNIPEFNEEQITAISDFEARLQYDVRFREDIVKKVSASKIFEEIIMNFDNLIKGREENSERMIVLSGHKSTYFAVLANLFDREQLLRMEGRLPMFGANIVFELVSIDGSEPVRYEVRVLINDIEHLIKPCSEHRCSADDFIAFLRTRVVPKVERYCSSKC